MRLRQGTDFLMPSWGWTVVIDAVWARMIPDNPIATAVITVAMSQLKLAIVLPLWPVVIADIQTPTTNPQDQGCHIFRATITKVIVAACAHHTRMFAPVHRLARPERHTP